MSMSILPEIYRHTARKSTVSKNVKTNNSSTSSLSYLANHHDGQIFQVPSATKPPPISYQIQMEKHLSTERFLLLPENEIEQMIVDENVDRFVHQTLDHICEQISSSTSTTDNQMKKPNDQINFENYQVEIDDIHQLLQSMLNTFPENDDRQETISNESNKVSPMDQDEIEEISTTSNCTCRCHLPSSPLNDEYQMFEKALQKTRLECEQEKLMQNNPLIQTLKRQHEELVNFVQQNKKFSRPNPVAQVDREQQTNKLICQDFQIQTDLTTIKTNGIIPTVKSPIPLNSPTIGTTSSSSSTPMTNGISTSTRIQTNPSTITRPRLSTNSKTNGTMSLPPAQLSPNNNRKPTITPPVPPVRTAHDVVDLTEEDEDDDTNRLPIQRPTASRVVPLPTPPTTTTAATAQATQTSAAAVATRARPNSTTRPARPVDPLQSAAQTFPLRPLPEHTPCDHTIARPQLSITQENGTVRLTWNLPLTPMELIQNYEIYAYKQNAAVTTSDWKKIGTVKSMRLPMAVTLKEFQSNSHYAFAVRAVSTTNQIGPFCEPKTIFTGNTPVQPLHTSQLLNVSS